MATPGHLITGSGREELMRKRGGEEERSVRGTCVMCVLPMATGLPSVLMLVCRAAAFAKMRPTFFSMSDLFASQQNRLLTRNC